MHEETACSTRTGVEVFVGAPYCGVDVPVVELERDVADGVGEVEDYEDGVLVCEGGDGGDVEEGTCVEPEGVSS